MPIPYVNKGTGGYTCTYKARKLRRRRRVFAVCACVILAKGHKF